MIILGRRKPGRCIIERNEKLSRKSHHQGPGRARPRKIGFEI